MQDQIYNDGLPVQASITDLIERDHDESRSATVRTFLVRESPQHEWKHARTRIDIGRADRVACDPFRWMYQTALVARLSLNIDQFLSTLAELVGKQQLRLPDLPIVALQGRSW